MLSPHIFRIDRNPVLLAVATASLASVATPVQAQEPSDTVAEVIVTGSRIKHTDEGALPVQIVTQEDIQRTGATNAEEFLQTVAVALQGNSNTVAASASGTTSGGVSGVSLRGLGSQRTLVLLNGRRIAGGGTITDSTTVDVNNIPLAAVERVEVLKDGASAIYGSDAIAGVVNFILRSDYQGAEVTLNYGDTSHGGASKHVSGILGLGDLAQDRYNAVFVASYDKDAALFGAQRDFSRSSINVAANNDTTSGNSFPANIAALDGSFGTLNPFAPNNCAPSVVSPFYPSTRCRYDPAPLVSLLPDAERYSVYGAAHFSLTDNIELYAEASYNHKKQNTVIQPVPLSDQFSLPANHPLVNVAPYNGFATIHLLPTSPYYPTAFVQAQTGGATPDLDVFYRSVITGNRDLTDTSKQPRGVVGAKGKLGTWDYDVAFLYSETKLIETANSGYPSYLGILPLLNSGQVNFFGPNTPAVQALADATQFIGDAYSTKTSLESISASMSGELVQLPAGALSVAFGAEGRREKFSIDPSAAIQSGDISGYSGNFFPLSVARDVGALFAEFNIPIVKSLEVGVAGRYDHYEGTGSKTVPKIDLRWKPVDQLLLRASFGKGFRAPSLSELYQPQQQGVTGVGLSDPLRCGTNGSSGRDCGTQFTTVFGGNPKLKPEQSDNYTLGIVVAPTSDLSLAADAFRIKLKDTIIFGIDPSAILGDLNQFGFLVTRGAPDPATPGLPGHIVQVQQTNLNFGETRVDGVDTDFRWRLPTGPAGTFTLGLTGTYFFKYEVQNLDGSFTSVNGKRSFITNGNGGVVPRWHHYLSVGWSAGPWNATLAQNYQAGYQDLPNAPGLSGVDVPRRVGSYLTHDVQGGYTGFDHLKLALGIKNVFDRDPPYTNAGGQDFFQAGYDPGYADPRGRFYYGMLTYSFL